MKVSELIEWLKTQDQEAIVEVVYHTSGRGYYDQGGNATTVEFEVDAVYSDKFEYTDWRDKIPDPAHPWYGKSFLQLGAMDA